MMWTMMTQVGAYRDDNGKPWTLPCVQEASERIVKSGVNHEYGNTLFCNDDVDDDDDDD